MSTKVWSIWTPAVVLFAAMSMFAADEAITDKAPAKGHLRFDSRIDTWVEGTLTSISADGKKFTVHGTKMPYATVKAQMMQDFHKKAEGLDQAKRQEKMAEVRKDWADRLEKSKTEDPGKPADYSFAMPAKGFLSIHEARQGHDFGWLRGEKAAAADLKDEQPIPVAADDKKIDSEGLLKFSDLKLNDRLMVGYDSGIITNEAYTAVRENAQPAPAAK